MVTLESFGLKPDCVYENSEIFVKHKDYEDDFSLISTGKKTVFYKDYNQNKRKMSLDKLEEVKGDIENFEPINKYENKQVESTYLGKGLYSNMDYSDSGIMVQHTDKEDWFYLISTSNKMIWYKEDDKNRKMTLKKLHSIYIPDCEEEKVEDNSEEKTDSEIYNFSDKESLFRSERFFDNDFIMASDPNLVKDNDLMFD